MINLHLFYFLPLTSLFYLFPLKIMNFEIFSIYNKINTFVFQYEITTVTIFTKIYESYKEFLRRWGYVGIKWYVHVRIDLISVCKESWFICFYLYWFIEFQKLSYNKAEIKFLIIHYLFKVLVGEFWNLWFLDFFLSVKKYFISDI